MLRAEGYSDYSPRSFAHSESAHSTSQAQVARSQCDLVRPKGRLSFEGSLYRMACAVLTVAFAIRRLAVGFESERRGALGESVPSVCMHNKHL